MKPQEGANEFGISRKESLPMVKARVLFVFIVRETTGEISVRHESLTKRRQFFVENRLCFNCGRAGHRESKCRSRGCFKCKGKHHTSLCDKPQERNNGSDHNAMLNGYSPSSEEKSLPAIVPLKIKGKTFGHIWTQVPGGISFQKQQCNS